MAFAEKTIYYALVTGSGLNGVVEANQFKTIGSGVFSIPENSGSTPVTFSSVYVDNYFRDITTATGNTINRTSVALVVSGTKLAVSESNALTQTGENIAGIFGPLNFTNVFTGSAFGSPNFAKNVSFSCETYYTQSTGTTTGMRAVSALIGLTYIYDTSAVTQSKSIIIPLYTRSGSMPSSSNAIHAFIPVLRSTDTDYLVEASCSIDQYFIVLEGNSQVGNKTGDVSCSFAIDSGAITVLPVIEGALGSDVWIRYIVPFPSESIPDLASTHSLNLWSSSGNYLWNMTARMYITYNFIPSISTKFLNSYKIGFNMPSPITGGAINASMSCAVYEREIIVPEPGTITLKNSGLDITLKGLVNPGMAMRAESQSIARLYDIVATTVAGQYGFSHGLTSGSYYDTPLSATDNQNAFSNFTNGSNILRVDAWRTTSNNPTFLSGWLYLNYVSDTSSLGIHTHTHTVEYTAISMSYLNTSEKGQTFTPRLSDFTGSKNWNIASIGLENQFWDSNAINFIATDLAILPSESGNPIVSSSQPAGMKRIFADYASTANEIMPGRWIAPAENVFKRYRRDPDICRLHPTGSRRIRNVASSNIQFGTKMYVSYSSITSSLGGTISSGSGGTVTIKVYNSKDQLYDTTTRVGNGAYSFDVYNPYDNYYVVAYENNTYKGRSKTGTPAQDFDIPLAGGGGGPVAGYTEYWF